MMSIIQKSKLWYIISGLLVLSSIISLSLWGLKLGIDFTGGSLLEVEFSDTRPLPSEIVSVLTNVSIHDTTVQPTGEHGSIIRFSEIDEDQHQAVLGALTENFGQDQEIVQLRFDSIGPVIGKELARKTFWAMGIVMIAIIAYIAWAFRKVSKPVASWRYGLIAVITVFHDVLITLGVFSILGQLYGLEMNASLIAALLTIFGYSVNDTIVVFDRIRENLVRRIGDEFDAVVELSIHQVMSRSINTTFTTLIVLFAVLVFGGTTIRNFAFALIIGIGVGAYSSIFLASPLLVTFQKLKRSST